MFFKYFPRTDYVIDNASFSIPDIFRRVAPNEKLVEQKVLEYYAVRDGQTPEGLSYDYYGQVQYYWTILLANNIIDPYQDWVKSGEDLYQFSLRKYGSKERLQEAHHYVYAGTDIQVDFDHNDNSGGMIVPVTNYEYEASLNEKKRNVSLIKRDYIDDFVKQFDELVRR